MNETARDITKIDFLMRSWPEVVDTLKFHPIINRQFPPKEDN